MFSGVVTTLIGLLLFGLEHKFPRKLAEFFMLDNPLYEDESKPLPIPVFLPNNQYSVTSSTPNVSTC